MRTVRVHLANPDFRTGECLVQFTLVYEGRLTTGRPQGTKKHEIRKKFHRQLKRLWAVDPLLSNWNIPIEVDLSREPPLAVPAMEWIEHNTPQLSPYRFIPLICGPLEVECAVEIRILRPTQRRGNAADVDNQIKILLDALKVPNERSELGKYQEPEDDESPFFVLAHDDKLITKITSVQDELLFPVSGNIEIEPTSILAMIDVYIRPQMPNDKNIIFFSNNNAVWDHRWQEGLPENLDILTSVQLKVRATQCIYRIRAMASHRENQHMLRSTEHIRRMEMGDMARAMRELNEAGRDEDFAERQVWRDDLWPLARAIKEALLKRIYGEPPYPTATRCMEIDSGTTAGPNPFEVAAHFLEKLVRQLG